MANEVSKIKFYMPPQVSKMSHFAISATKWVAVARHGLKLCQDGALPIPIISVYVPEPKTDQKNQNFENL